MEDCVERGQTHSRIFFRKLQKFINADLFRASQLSRVDWRSRTIGNDHLKKIFVNTSKNISKATTIVTITMLHT